MKRQIVHIDEELCDGCGDCVPACAEGAIQIVDGTARLVSDVYCDGLGACLGECPQDAIEIIEREAEDFDETAVEHHLEALNQREKQPAAPEARPAPVPISAGCPGAAARMLRPVPGGGPAPTAGPSRLANWPVQIHLVPIQAPYFDQARLLIAADCVPFAYPGFHEDLLAGRVLLVGCPKLDDTELYWRKLGSIFKQNDIESIEVAIMEVPCCIGLLQLVEQALSASGKDIRVTMTRLGIEGDVLDRRVLHEGSAGAELAAEGAHP